MILLLNLLLVPIGGVLWFLGGCGDECDHPEVPDLDKAWRRYIWPVVCGLVLLTNGISFRPIVMAAALMMVANAMGYGERKNWVERSLVALLLGIPAMFVYWSWVWPVATLLTFIPLYWLSLRYNWFTWHVVEVATGAMQGACILAALLSR